MEQVYSPVSFFLTLAMDNVEFAPFSIRSVLTLHTTEQWEKKKEMEQNRTETLTDNLFVMEKLAV